MKNNYLLILDIYNHKEQFTRYQLKKTSGIYKLLPEEIEVEYAQNIIQFLNTESPCQYILDTFGLMAYKPIYENIAKEELQVEFKTKSEYKAYAEKVINACEPSINETRELFKDYVSKIYNQENTKEYAIASKQMRELLFIVDKSINKKLFKKFENAIDTDIKIDVKSHKQHSLLQEEVAHYYIQSDDLIVLLYTELKYLMRYNSFYINKCEYCGDFFIPVSRSDEKFCSKVYTDGSSCRLLGVRNNWKTVLEEDEVRKLYNNLYQKKLMYCKRNSGDLKAKKEFESWKKMAKDMMKKYKNGVIAKKEIIEIFNKNI